jgi:hypothetical protein
MFNLYRFHTTVLADPISLAVGLGSLISSGVGALGTAGGLTALGGLAGAGAGIYAATKGGAKAPATPAMPTAAPPVQSPTGSPTSNTGSGGGPSFLAAAAAPAANQTSGAKSLLGQ